MEKIYSKEQLEALTEAKEKKDLDKKVKLKNGHIIFEAELGRELFGSTRQAYAVYYDNTKTILFAPDTDQVFKSAHDVIMLFIKTKNLKGDLSISIQEFMADFDINQEERYLEFLWAPGLTMIHITL